MTKQKKHIDYKEYKRYLHNKMTNAERNAFERELQKHPFEAEALEGLQQISAEEIQQDLNVLSKKITGKKKRNTPVWAAAASILLLISVGIIWVQLKNNSPIQEMAESEKIQQKSVVEKESKTNEKSMAPTPAKEFEIEIQEETETAKNTPPLIKRITDKSEVATTNQITSSPKKINEDFTLKQTNKQSDPKIYQAKQTNQNIEIRNRTTTKEDTQIKIRGMSKTNLFDGKKDNLAIAIPVNKSATQNKIVKGMIISAADSLPLAGSTITERGTANSTISDVNGNFTLNVTNNNDSTFVARFIGMENTEFKYGKDSANIICLEPSRLALDEVVVTGYQQSRKKQTVGFTTVVKEKIKNKPPQPIGGIDAYKAYLKEQAVLNDNYQAKKVAVRVKLFFNTDGEITKIENANNAETTFFEKAKKMILDGAEWSPEFKNGNNIEGNTVLKIVFKKQKYK